jgi:hypothetical protein
LEGHSNDREGNAGALFLASVIAAVTGLPFVGMGIYFLIGFLVLDWPTARPAYDTFLSVVLLVMGAACGLLSIFLALRGQRRRRSGKHGG